MPLNARDFWRIWEHHHFPGHFGLKALYPTPYTSKAPCEHFLSSGAHFEVFWVLVAKWLSDGLWRLVLSSFRLWWPNCSQITSGGSFWALLGSGGQTALRWHLETNFELFWDLVASGAHFGASKPSVWTKVGL